MRGARPWVHRILTKDLPDASTFEPLSKAAGEGYTDVRIASMEALTKHDDPRRYEAVARALSDRKLFQAVERSRDLRASLMAMLLDIGLYVVGGGVAKAGDLLLEPARAMVPRCSYQSVSSRVRIVATQLGEDGPILGCGWLAKRLACG